MSGSKAGKDSDGSKPTIKRNLPSWMGLKQDTSNFDGGKKARNGAQEGNETDSDLSTSNFLKLMEGVVFVLSGFVNPERATLRSQALEMGAEYQPDWNSNCTLLVCAFPNTPKFRQVESDLGTIVSKDWIAECYKHRQLIDIEPYLMHVGKPWRKQSVCKDNRSLPLRKSQEKIETSCSDLTNPAPSKGIRSNGFEECFYPSNVKQWVAEDLNRTISWLGSQDEKPEPDEIEKIAAEGILTCLQDTIDSLKQGKDVQQITEQWACIPRAVEELAKFQASEGHGATRVQKEDLCKQAETCKQVYEQEFRSRNQSQTKGREPSITGTCDSDETIEMTEEEIDKAYDSVCSTIPKW
ncbi:hypothetical protein DM860_010098 [Cuscuta australis]|uniref:BRCT domain-containing protein n=1 Tax=Cuscuta australis TaxID=267555 RepID=A0A328D786_9ASTE|nr:hypothetical protein DM860_010098 [Cuscuta australis]